MTPYFHDGYLKKTLHTKNINNLKCQYGSFYLDAVSHINLRIGQLNNL